PARHCLSISCYVRHQHLHSFPTRRSSDLICTATPFMVLAGVVEEHKRDVEALRKTEERFRLASRAGKMFAYEWDVATDVVVHTAGSAEILDIEPGVRITGEEIFAKVHPEDLGRLKYA